MSDQVDEKALLHKILADLAPSFDSDPDDNETLANQKEYDRRLWETNPELIATDQLTQYNEREGFDD